MIPSMKDKTYTVGIIGGGAVGLTFAALLADSANIIIKTRSQNQAEEIKSRGIYLTERLTNGKEKQEIISGIDATSDASKFTECDAVIITVKSYDTESVAKEFSSVFKDITEIITVQNGLLAYDLLKKNIKNPEQIFAGVAYIGSARLNDYRVSVGDNLRIVLDAKATITGRILQASRFEFESTNEIKQAVWEKVAINAAQNALGAITGLTLGEMGESEECLEIGFTLLKEFEEVANAEGVSFPYSLQDKLIKNWEMSHHPSMWQDLQNKKRTEIDAINGAISFLGKKHGIATPYNDMMTSLIKVLEKK